MDPMKVGKDISLDELGEIVTHIAIEHGIIRVYLFGSRAREDNNKDSDFDFCIVVPEEYDLMDIGSFFYDIKEALGTEIDMVCEDDIMKKPSFMEEILRDRKILFEA
ncbi:MAG: nucleotidyltransferase domain-containing protein [Candidatus Methanoplasma sp.]|jgi:predicted nucleotidyltransferase|nr:nucleotidyltransferase domain-containing protein [Candidatus Methanoplasma sp.]